MFITQVKAVFVEGLQQTFDDEYVTPDFRSIWVGLEYPAEESNYPGIWVDFIPTQDLQVAGIAHEEWTQPGLTGERRKVTRWRFAGMLTLTCVALTVLERDRLLDEITRVMAFGMEDPATADFRRYIEQNDLIGLQVQWDKFALSGFEPTPGTPWGTDDVVWEATASVDCQGEFVSDGTDRAFIPLSSIEVFHKAVNEPSYVPSDPVPLNEGWQ